MAAQDNLHIAREMFAAWNAHDVEAFIKRLDTKTTWESDAFPAPFSGHEGARQFFKVYVTAFPDLHLDIEQILAAGDSHVVVRWRSRGTHLGTLADIPATGRKASNHGCTVMETRTTRSATLGSTSTTRICSDRSGCSWGSDVGLDDCSSSLVARSRLDR